MVDAGIWLAMDDGQREKYLMCGQSLWPADWSPPKFKSRVDDLTRGIALMVAELDRLLRINNPNEPQMA